MVVAAFTCTTEVSAFVAAPAAAPASTTCTAFARRCSPAQQAPAPSTPVRIASRAANGRLGQEHGYRHHHARLTVMDSSSSSSMGEYTSSRGLVFPTDREEGWFDSATVGSPRVHRCERPQRRTTRKKPGVPTCCLSAVKQLLLLYVCIIYVCACLLCTGMIHAACSSILCTAVLVLRYDTAVCMYLTRYMNSSSTETCAAVLRGSIEQTWTVPYTAACS